MAPAMISGSALLVFLHEHHLVVSEASVDEAVHKGCCKVVSCRVEVRHASNAAALEVALVDILCRLGLKNVELLAKGLEVLRQLNVGKRVLKLLVVAHNLVRKLEHDALARDQETELLLQCRVLRLVEIGLDEIDIVQSNGQHHGLRILLAHAGIRVLVDIVGQLLDNLELAHEVDGIGLSVTLQEGRHENEGEIDQILRVLICDYALAVDLSNLKSQVARVLVAP
ncbi:hypothetical protein BN1708_003237 [Verticillium longisporum]|uniref:Secreted protein n=1 Tax=Verticillium longisporum TaxID=100787 RepID=A0A0G4LDH6_VERLO|nr:hypothetical protein BN1708_003237 [Verticillium longisporum]